MKVKHWRGFPGTNGWKCSPMLEFGYGIYAFFQSGLRFSRNAFTPSVWSS